MNEPSMPSPGEPVGSRREELPSSPPGSRGTPYRLSDAERSSAIAELSDAFAEGRLDAEEFEARMTAASQARLSHELEPLFADLPAPHTVRPSNRPRPPAQVPRRPAGHLPADRWVAGPPWAASGYPAQLAPHYVRRQPRRPARHHPGPIAFLPFAVLMLIGTSAAFLIPVVIVALVGLAHVVPRAQRRG